MSKEKLIIQDLFQSVGIRINGDNAYDIQVHNEKLYKRILYETALGLGESYMDGWWDCQAIDIFFERILKAHLEDRIKQNWKIAAHALRSKFFNLQKIARAYQIGERHYDLGNDLYRSMLDKRMNYTCGYWKKANNLDQAQEAKLELVCKKLNLKPGMSILELGCGFGAFAGYAAEKYDVTVTGVTVSKQQVELGNKLYKDLPVKILLKDYRNVTGKYDRVISIGMMEHVGYKNYRTYMEVVSRTLKNDGLAFLHTIGDNESTTLVNDWTNKYIFPNSMLPSIQQLGKAMEGLFIVEDWHNFGPDYDKTLMAWYKNLENAWPALKNKYDKRFQRMWRFYLLSSAGGFRARHNQLWQIVMSKPGTKQPNCRFS